MYQKENRNLILPLLFVLVVGGLEYYAFAQNETISPYPRPSVGGCFGAGYDDGIASSFNQTQNELCGTDYYQEFIKACTAMGNTEAHCSSLRPVVPFNQTAADEAIERLANVLGQGDCAEGEVSVPGQVEGFESCVEKERLPIILGEMKRQQEAIK